jgi:hypothetical protein
MADGFCAINSPSPGLSAILSPFPWGEGEVVPILLKSHSPCLRGEGWGEGWVVTGSVA